MAPNRRPSLSAYQLRPKPTHSATPIMASKAVRKRKGLEAFAQGRLGFEGGCLRLVGGGPRRAQRRAQSVGNFQQLARSLGLERGRTLGLQWGRRVLLGRGDDEWRRFEIDTEHRLDLDVCVRVGHELDRKST